MDTLVQIGGAAGLTLAVVQFVVKAVIKDGRWWPVAGVVVGILLTVAVAFTTTRDPQALVAAAVQGVISGLVASGAWSGVRALAGK